MYASQPATIDAVACRVGCADLDAARAGSTVRLRGSAMAAVDQVTFLGGPGPEDDVQAKPSRVNRAFVDVRVPARAVGGPLRLFNLDGAPSAPSAALDIDRGPTTVAAAGSVPAVQAKLNGRKVFAGSKAGAQLSYLVADQKGANVVVQVTRATDGVVVGQWAPGVVASGTVQTVSWDGKDSSGKAAPEGRYEFRVYTSDPAATPAVAPAPAPAASPVAASAQPATAKKAQAAPVPTAAAPFLLVDHKFPVRGKHTYGEGPAAFGAGRGGHSHQGQDVMAACGTPLVAARGGTIKIKQTQALAGNFVVIDEDGTDVDAVYMHLREPALADKNDTVYTGQVIGYVGRTGDASVCHLHFELWSGPGWYTGGSPFDPLPSLKAWDALS